LESENLADDPTKNKSPGPFENSGAEKAALKKNRAVMKTTNLNLALILLT
jgi:hypothetical protein